MLESGFRHFPQALSLQPFYLLQSIKVLSAHLKCQCAISVYKCKKMWSRLLVRIFCLNYD